MKKYTKSENDLRKKIFDYKSYYKYCSKNEIYRNFGSSKAVKKATEDAFNRASCNEAKELTLLEFIVNNNSSRYSDMAKCLPDSGYRMGEVKEVYIYAKNQKIRLGEADNTCEYAQSCKFKAKHGYISACLPVRYLHAKAEGGLITLRHKESSVKNIYHAEWLQLYSEKKYSSVAEYTIEKGFVFDYKRLYNDKVAILTYHARSLQLAKEMRKKLNANFLADYKNYKYEKEKKEKQISLTKKLIKKVLFEAYVIEDSIKAGNCVAGTRAFITRHNLGKDVKLMGFDLLKLAKKDSAKSYAYNLFQNRAMKYNECLDKSIFNKLLDACVINERNHTIKFD